MALHINRMASGFWPIVFAGSLVIAGLNGCGGASAPAAMSAPAPVKARAPGIHEFVGAVIQNCCTGDLVDGIGAEAMFFDPGPLAADQFGNVYVSDVSNKALRKVTAAGVVSTVATPVGSSAPFADITFDNSGNRYLLDSEGTVYKTTPTGAETTLVMPPDQLYPGTDGARATRIAADKNGNLYIAYLTLRKIVNPDSGEEYMYPFYTTVHKVSPNGTWTMLPLTKYYQPDLEVDGAGSLYVADSWDHTIVKISAAGVVSTFAGTPGAYGEADGVGAAARFCQPSYLAVDAGGNVYVYEDWYRTIRKITPSGSVTTLAGTPGSYGVGVSQDGLIPRVSGMAIDANGDLVLSVRNGLIKIAAPDLAPGVVVPTRPTGCGWGPPL